MGKGERGGGGVEMRARVGGEVSIFQSTKIHQCCSGENFFRAKNFFVDDASGLYAIGPVR